MVVGVKLSLPLKHQWIPEGCVPLRYILNAGRLGDSVGPASDFSSGHDLMVHCFEPHVRLWADSMELAWDSLSPTLSTPSLLMLSLSLSNQ